MKVGTLSVLCGTSACNLRCPFCVAKLTAVGRRAAVEINKPRLYKAIRLAKHCGVSTVLITGKGEPLLFPEMLESYVAAAGNLQMPVIELQTNGTLLKGRQMWQLVDRCVHRGLTTVCLSVTHWSAREHSALVGADESFNYWRTAGRLLRRGLSVRLCYMLIEGFIDSPKGVERVINMARKRDITQLTFRNISRPDGPRSFAVSRWVEEHRLDPKSPEIDSFISAIGTHVLDLPHGGRVYDVDGQNVCIGNCLTRTTDPENQRQLIFVPDGHVYYDWNLKGAILF